MSLASDDEVELPFFIVALPDPEEPEAPSLVRCFFFGTPFFFLLHSLSVCPLFWHQEHFVVLSPDPGFFLLLLLELVKRTWSPPLAPPLFPAPALDLYSMFC